MNMQKILLEAMSYKDDAAIRKEANGYLAELRNYVFPVQVSDDICANIKDRLGQNQPVSFEWALNEYYKNIGTTAEKRKFLFDLGRSLLPERQGRMFFEHGSAAELEANKRKYPLVASLKGGPKIFELFFRMLSPDLVKLSDNSFTTTFNDDGTSTTQKRDDEAGLSDITGKFFSVFEDALREKCKYVKNSTTMPEYSKYSDAVLYAAYLGFIFDVFHDATRPTSETDGSSAKFTFDEVFSRGAHNVAKFAVNRIPDRTSLGSLDNWGSVYNQGKNVMRTIDPERLSNSNLSEIRVYPQYVVDVLRLTKKTKNPFIDLLKNGLGGKYSAIGEALDKGTKGADNTIIPISSKSFIAMLSDPEFIKECVGRDMGEIFKKWGDSWVVNGRSYLQDVLASEPQVNNSDDDTVRAVPVAVGPSLKRSNTDREFTGDDIIAQTHITMQIGKGSVIKDLSAKQIEADAARRKDEGLSLDEWVEELKQEARSGTNLNEDDQEELWHEALKKHGLDEKTLSKNVKNAFKRTTPNAETSVVFDLYDGTNPHTFKVDGEIDNKLDATDFQNIIARKVKAGGEGHVYFISIPHGIAFATMQDDDGTIVRNENMDTLCRGLNCNGAEYNYKSVRDLMRSPIGRYCNAVVRKGKTGRIQFSTKEANTALGKVLSVLKDMKEAGQTFNPGPVDKLSTAIKVISQIMSTSAYPDDEVESILNAFMNPELVMSVETYNPSDGKFSFHAINHRHRNMMGAKLIKHLSDMYNLDNTVRGYNAQNVANILDVVAPGNWNLTQWNYGNVLRAASASYGASDDVNVEDVEGGVNAEPDTVGEGELTDADVWYPEVKGVDNAFDDNINNQTADDGGVGDVASEDEVGHAGIGGEEYKLVHDAFETVFDTLFPNPEAVKFNEKDTASLKKNLVTVLDRMQKQGSLDIKVAHKVAGLDTTDFQHFIQDFWKTVSEAIDKKPDVTDNSLRMSAFIDDEDENNAMFGGVSESEVKDILKAGLNTDDAMDKILIPEIGSLMVKYAMDDSLNNDGLENKFDSDYLVSCFNKKFSEDLHAKLDEVTSLKKTVETDTTINKEQGERALKEATLDAAKYKKIQEKLDNDPNYIAQVADIVVKNGSTIVGLVNGMPTDISKSFVPFDADTLKSYSHPGLPLLKFCMYDTEMDGTTSNATNNLNRAFTDSRVKAMMNDLFNSVPKECLTIDYTSDENGIARLDTKPVKDMEEAQIQVLESHYNKSGKRNDISNFYTLESQIDSIYSKGGDVTSIFGLNNNSGKSSPYQYKGTDIDLKKVKQFFDTLMELAASYNDIGYSDVGGRTIDRQKRIQQTANNERQKSKVLINQHFVDLKSSFDDFMNAIEVKSQLSPEEKAGLKKVMDKVMTQVIANPMNVLINNNAKLITAYAYQNAIVNAENRSLYQSGKEHGFGTGFGMEANKEPDRQGALLGLNNTVDQTVNAYRVAYGIAKSAYIKHLLKSSRVTIDQAEADYKAYLKDYGDGYGAVEVLKRALKDGSVDTQKDNVSLFCNYQVDESNKKQADAVTELRKQELVLLLYKTAADIVDSRSKLGTPTEFEERLAAQGDLVKNLSSEILPQKLIEKLRNLGAELQLADSEKYHEVMNAAKDPESFEPTEYTSPNDPIETSASQLRGFDKVPENTTTKIIDDILSDKELDMKGMQNAFNAMDKAGDPQAGTRMNFSCKLNVVKKDNNDMLISTSIKLQNGDYIVVPGETPRPVTKVIDAQNKLYNIPPISRLNAGDKEVPFSRYQARNRLQGKLMAAKLPDVVRKLNEWYNEVRKKGGLPTNVMDKITMLKLLYEGCSGADAMKSIVAYLVWKVSGYDYSFKPSKILLGGNPGMEDWLVRTIVADLKTFAPGAPEENQAKYENILSILPDGFDRLARKFNFTLVTPKMTRQGSSEEAKNVKSTMYMSDARNNLKMLVDAIGQSFGYVKAAQVQKALQTQSILDNFHITKEAADKTLAALKGKLKPVLDAIIKDHNWSVAQPLVSDYRRNDATPTVDGALQYIKDNYDIKKIDNTNEFVNYIKKECKTLLELALGI